MSQGTIFKAQTHEQRQDRQTKGKATEYMFTIIPIGYVSSSLTQREHAPKQGNEGAPEAWLVFKPEFQEGLRDLRVGEEILVLTWLDRSDRQTLQVHPRDDQSVPLRGVFSTRSQDRPNPVGIHRVRIVECESPIRFKVLDLEAFDATPIIDVKPVFDRVQER
jgi:tRNA-Thr(GGU) m(6)t(6)A37 methyltransferase TsaA